MSDKIFDLGKYAACARQVSAEGAVLLKNENHVLPLKEGSSVAVFGRSQYNYYKSGTGSGGLVNVSHVVSIPEALGRKFVLNKEINDTYVEWIKQHPYEYGSGWGEEPWFQEEMPLSDELVGKAAAESETAVIIIGRTAGEDQDNKAEQGSYLLTDAEEDMLKKVCGAFSKTVVLLNVGNIIDMKWVEKYNPGAVLYVWQGGQEGGNGVLDVLDGTVTPCGRLSDTIARDITDYPSTVNHGDPDRNIYQEDIYVGYRYFETFKPEKVLYPFGFGLSYTSFTMEVCKIASEKISRNGKIAVSVNVANNGDFHGKEVVQVYVRKPMGALGQPLRSLCGYAKTGDLKPGESETVEIFTDWYGISTYDDGGVTGHKSCYVLEAGEYIFYVGGDVRSAKEAGRITVEETVVIEALEEAMAPVEACTRFRPGGALDDGTFALAQENMPLRTVAPLDRRAERLPEEYAYTGDKGYKLVDVRDGKLSMGEFIAQLSDEDLCAIMRGEGMSSPKVTPGTGGAFAGVTDSLLSFGIPVCCCTDGPSGIRMDCGKKAFSMPNGTCMACTFNDELIQEVYEWEGMELRKNRVDVLLGPGMNIHRSPLNGRNFEYFSEDPLLTGKMGAAQLKGMHKYHVTGTIKHFACNNQEFRRFFVNAVVSERALREIYLKGFEIAVKEGGAYCIMSAYCPVNGIYTASNYDLLTTILRREWGFDGIVMSDWWAKGNEEGEPGTAKNTAQIARAQNDLYMVVKDAAANSNGDNSLEGIRKGIVARAEMQRNAANICRTLMRMPSFDHFLGMESELDKQLKACETEEDEALSNVQTVDIENGSYELSPELIDARKGSTSLFQVFTRERGEYKLCITCHAEVGSPLAQIPLSVFQEKNLAGTVNLTGEDTQDQTFEIRLEPAFMGSFYLKMFFGHSGMVITRCTFELVKSMEEEIRRTLEKVHG